MYYCGQSKFGIISGQFSLGNITWENGSMNDEMVLISIVHIRKCEKEQDLAIYVGSKVTILGIILMFLLSMYVESDLRKKIKGQNTIFGVFWDRFLPFSQKGP